MTTVEIAGKLNLCQSAVSRLSIRGEEIENEYGVELINKKCIKSYSSLLYSYFQHRGSAGELFVGRGGNRFDKERSVDYNSYKNPHF